MCACVTVLYRVESFCYLIGKKEEKAFVYFGLFIKTEMSRVSMKYNFHSMAEPAFNFSMKLSAEGYKERNPN